MLLLLLPRYYEAMHIRQPVNLSLLIFSLTAWYLRASFTVLAIAVALGYSMVYANGGATAVSSQEAGPYRIDVSTLPGQAVVGKTHLSIIIRSLASKNILTTAEVIVSATGPEGATDLGPTPAVNDNPPFFELDVPFDVEGDWEVNVAVSSELGDGAIKVPLQVREGGNNISWILMLALGIAILAGGVWPGIGYPAGSPDSSDALSTLQPSLLLLGIWRPAAANYHKKAPEPYVWGPDFSGLGGEG